jgi:heat shock protein HslJ
MWLGCAALAFVVAACGSGSAGVDASRRTLQGPLWEWKQVVVTTPASVTNIEHPELYTLTFQPDGKLVVKADCNQALGSYTEDGTKLTIELGASTLAVCPEGSRSAELIGDLTQVRSFSIGEAALVLTMADSAGDLRFHDVEPDAATTTTAAP